MSPASFKRWLSSYHPRVEVIPGLHAGGSYGALTDVDVKPGEPVRAGGYAENRSIYSQDLFAPAGEEPRTVHLGIDIFAPADTEVFAPVDARVHSFKDNARPGDYGPTIILEHATDGEVFYTLYGHLSRASLDGLMQGKRFHPGACVGRLGSRTENGGWPPHLHFQIILDLKGMSGDYPGVCRRSESEKWLAICPDPADFLGLRVA